MFEFIFGFVTACALFFLLAALGSLRQERKQEDKWKAETRQMISRALAAGFASAMENTIAEARKKKGGDDEA